MPDSPSPPSPWPRPRSRPVAYSIDARWWSLGMVDGFKQQGPRPGVPDQFSYKAGRVEGTEGRKLGYTIESIFAKFQLPYREAHFAPMPPLVGPLKDSP